MREFQVYCDFFFMFAYALLSEGTTCNPTGTNTKGHMILFDYKALEICVCKMSFVNFFFCSFALASVIIIHSNYPIVSCPLLQEHWISVKTCPVYCFNSLILLLPSPFHPHPSFSVLCYLEDNFHISAICLRKAQDLEVVADLGQQV